MATDKYSFILGNWAPWRDPSKEEQAWSIVVLEPTEEDYIEHTYMGNTAGECVKKAIRDFDEAVRRWGYKPESSSFGRWLALGVGWKL